MKYHETLEINFMKKSVVHLIEWIIFAVLIEISQSYGSENIPLAILNGTLIDGTGGKPVQNAAVIVQQDRILAAGPAEQIDIPANAQCLDVKGATILPGFINAHIHQGYNEQNLKAFAQSGVTTVRDLGAHTRDEKWFERCVALNKESKNARLVAAGPFITVPDGYPFIRWGILAIMVTSPDDAVRQTEVLLQKGADLVKLSLETGKILKLNIPAPSPEIAAAVVSTAHSHGTVVSAHITSAQDVERAIKAGVNDIAHMPFDDLPPKLITGVIKAGIYWVPTLEYWYGIDYNNQMHQNAINNLRRFVQAGGKVAMGTDFAGASSNFDPGMPVREIKWMHAAGMTPMQIIVAATKNAAYICNLEKIIGTVEPGKIADVLVVKGNPLDDLRVLTNVVMVIHNGVIIRQEKTVGNN